MVTQKILILLLWVQSPLPPPLTTLNNAIKRLSLCKSLSDFELMVVVSDMKALAINN